MNETYYEEACRVINEVKKAITGKDSCVRLAMAAILAGGHILIDDIPGVGKTTLAMSFARAMKLESCRIQFTPDVLPSDILGFPYIIRTGELLNINRAQLCVICSSPMR